MHGVISNYNFLYCFWLNVLIHRICWTWYIPDAGQGIAEAISSKRVDKRFAGKVMDDDTLGSTQELSSGAKEQEESEHNFYFN